MHLICNGQCARAAIAVARRVDSYLAMYFRARKRKGMREDELNIQSIVHQRAIVVPN